jgi:hypothetical protein
MKGRAAPWFASPDRADCSVRMIARLLQLDKPERPMRPRRDVATAGEQIGLTLRQQLFLRLFGLLFDQ